MTKIVGSRPRKQFAHGSIVVEMLDEWLADNPGFSNYELATRIGVKRSANCFITQIRSGRSKLPFAKIIPLARVLGKDPKPMVEAALSEYYPELEGVLDEVGLLQHTGSVENLKNLKAEEKIAS